MSIWFLTISEKGLCTQFKERLILQNVYIRNFNSAYLESPEVNLIFFRWSKRFGVNGLMLVDLLHFLAAESPEKAKMLEPAPGALALRSRSISNLDWILDIGRLT